MKYIYIYLIACKLIYCDCVYKGSYSKVILDVEKNIYKSISIELGEKLIYVDFYFCNKKGKRLKLKGKVTDQDVLIGNDKFINTEIIIIRCDKNGNIKETIVTTEKNGLFDFETLKDKKGFLVFKKKDSNEGIKYNIKSFR